MPRTTPPHLGSSDKIESNAFRRALVLAQSQFGRMKEYLGSDFRLGACPKRRVFDVVQSGVSSKVRDQVLHRAPETLILMRDIFVKNGKRIVSPTLKLS